MSQRISCHSGRKGIKGVYNPKHNDRTGKVNESGHIDYSKTALNRYINYVNNDSFLEGEKEFYRRFDKYIEERNNRYKKHGVKERCKSLDDYRTSSRTCPVETILQIGNRNTIKDLSYIMDADELLEFMRRLLIKAFKLFAKEMRKYKANYSILNCALHLDEETPHLHYRAVVHYYDEESHCEKVGASQGYKAMGFERPNEEQEEGRYNNRAMSFSKYQRYVWIECLQKTLEELKQTHPEYKRAIEVLADIEHVAKSNQKAIEKNEYIIKQQEEEIKRQKRTIEYINEFNEYVDECEQEYEREEVTRTR